jgi:hypothetical protein
MMISIGLIGACPVNILTLVNFIKVMILIVLIGIRNMKETDISGAAGVDYDQPRRAAIKKGCMLPMQPFVSACTVDIY